MRLRWWAYLGVVLLCGAALAWAASSGPDPFPTHYGLSGSADSWRPRGSAIVELALVAGGLALVFAGLSRFATRLPASLVNTPRRDYWLSPEHRPAFDEVVSGFFLRIGGLVLLLEALTVVLSIVDTGQTAARAALLVLFLLTVAANIVYLFWLLSHPPRAADRRR